MDFETNVSDIMCPIKVCRSILKRIMYIPANMCCEKGKEESEASWVSSDKPLFAHRWLTLSRVKFTKYCFNLLCSNVKHKKFKILENYDFAQNDILYKYL